jgi:hypothetical protein
MGLPVLRTLSLYTCRRHYPGTASERIASLISSRRISLPRKGCRVDLRIVLFEACSAFTRVTACILALSPIRDTLIEGFSHFVTSMTAPIASGWSDCRVGLAPTGKRRLCTAHTRLGHCLRPGWLPVIKVNLASFEGAPEGWARVAALSTRCTWPWRYACNAPVRARGSSQSVVLPAPWRPRSTRRAGDPLLGRRPPG